MLPQKIFEMNKVRLTEIGENEFHTTKFPDLSCFLKNSEFFSLY